MRILVIDGMGGGLGAQIVTKLKKILNNAEIIAVGTNATATSNIIKAGANKGATGENAVKVCLKDASCIIGPIGIVLADSMLGEITPEIAHMISSSNVEKVLIPVNHDNINIVGLDGDKLMSDLINDGVHTVKEIIDDISN